jgi:hypothetical protein
LATWLAQQADAFGLSGVIVDDSRLVYGNASAVAVDLALAALDDAKRGPVAEET